MMSSSTGLVRYVVYMPSSPTVSCVPIRVRGDAEVEELLTKIRDHPDFKQDIGNEKVLVYKCGGLPMMPDSDDPAESVRGVRYKQVARWLKECTEEPMENASDLLEYFPNGPAEGKDKMIDVIAVTTSILDDIRSTPVPQPVDQEPETFLRVAHSENELRGLVTVKYSGNIPNIRWRKAVQENGFDRKRELPQSIKDIVHKPRCAPDDRTGPMLSAIKELLRPDQHSRTEDESDESTGPTEDESDGSTGPTEDESDESTGPTEDESDESTGSTEDESDESTGSTEEELNKFTRLCNKLDCAEDTATPYVAWNLEPVHFTFAAVASSVPEKAALLDTTETRRSVLGWFKRYWVKEVDSEGCDYNKQIPFPIIIHVQPQNELCKYTPRPDANFLEHNIPRFLVEIDSHCGRNDERRLIVYTSCMLRLLSNIDGKGVFRDESDKKVFLMAAFFSDTWVIDRYFFFLDDEDKVCLNHQKFDMGNPREFTDFLHEFYNYAHHVREGAKDSQERPDMKKISKAIAGSIKKTLHSMGSPDPKGTKGSKGKSNSPKGQGSKQPNDADIHDAMVDALKGSDYELEEYPEDFGPLIDLPGHIAQARDSNQKPLIVKLVRKRSHERILLDEMSGIKSPLNHVVPLFSTIMSSLGLLLVIERGNSLSVLGRIGEGKSERLSRELIEGVAFLHKHVIAHLDIKPDNIICSFMTERLLIIDFDLAMKCNDVEETVERSCGTTGWSAPEIVLDNDKPMRAFVPIRADLWSCGRVLWFIGEMGGYSGLKQLIKMLTSVDPRRRPLLHEVVDEDSVSWSTERLLQAFGHPRNVKADQGTPPVVNRLKRTRDDVSSGSEEGLAPKLLKEPYSATTFSDGSDASSSSNLSSEMCSLLDESDYITKVDDHSRHLIRLAKEDVMYPVECVVQGDVC